MQEAHADEKECPLGVKRYRIWIDAAKGNLELLEKMVPVEKDQD